MSALAKKYATDAELERKGVAVEFAENPDGSFITLILARAGADNPEYKKVADRIFGPHRQAMERKVFPQARREALTREVFAEAGVLGWKNMPKAEVTGNEKDEGYIEYTKERCLALFEKYPEFYNDAVGVATERGTFQREQLDVDSGNSLPS